MSKHPLTPVYVVFYLLFAPDTWRVLIGMGLAFFLTPRIVASHPLGAFGRVMLWGMLVAIGWAVSAIPGQRLADLFKGLVLGRKNR